MVCLNLAAATTEFPGRDAALLVLTSPWLSVAQIDGATSLAGELGVRISLIDSSGWSAPELALRTGGFVVHLQDIRHYGTAFGAMNQALSNTLSFYRSRIRTPDRQRDDRCHVSKVSVRGKHRQIVSHTKLRQ